MKQAGARLRNAALAAGLMAGLAGCAKMEQWVYGPPEPEPPLYCYGTLSDADCHAVPLRGQEKRLINYYGPPPPGPAGWRPPKPLPEWAPPPEAAAPPASAATANPTAPAAAPASPPAAAPSRSPAVGAPATPTPPPAPAPTAAPAAPPPPAPVARSTAGEACPALC